MKPLTLLLALLLSGCSYINYQREGVSVTGIEFGTDKALAGFLYKANGVEVSVESLHANQTNSLSAIVEGAVAGTAKAMVP